MDPTARAATNLALSLQRAATHALASSCETATREVRAAELRKFWALHWMIERDVIAFRRLTPATAQAGANDDAELQDAIARHQARGGAA